MALATHNEQDIAKTIVAEFNKENIECAAEFLTVTEDGATVTEEE